MKTESHGFEESKELRSLLEEKFSKLIKEEEVPSDLKQEVFASLNSLIMFGDLADLFTVKFAQTNIRFISPFEGGENGNDAKKKKDK